MLIGNYKVLEELGRGSFGVVYKARKGNEEVCALKELDLQEQEKNVDPEEECSQKKLKHDNLVMTYTTNKIHKGIYIAMEFCEMNLEEYFIKRRPSLAERYGIMIEICRGVTYLHHQNIIHGNIHPSNVMMKQKGDAFISKISDYQMSEIRHVKRDLWKLQEGNTGYLAPETQKTGQEFSTSMDVFTCGLLLFAVFKSTVLRDRNTEKEHLIPGEINSKGNIEYLNRKLQQEIPNESVFLSLYFKTSDSNIGRLLYSMLKQKPRERLQMEEVLIKIIKAEVENDYQMIMERKTEEIRDLQNEEIKIKQQFKSFENDKKCLQNQVDTKEVKVANLEGKLEAKEAYVKTLLDEKDELRKESNIIKTLQNKLEKQKQDLEDKKPEKWAFIYTMMALGVSVLIYSIISMVNSKQNMEIQTQSLSKFIREVRQTDLESQVQQLSLFY